MFPIWMTVILTIIIASKESNAHESFPMGEKMVDVTRTQLVRAGDTSPNRMGHQVGASNFCGAGKTCSSNDFFANCCQYPDGICCGDSLCCPSGQSCCAGRCCSKPNAICCHTYCCDAGSRCSGHNDQRCIPFGNNAGNVQLRNSGCTFTLTLAYLLGLHRLHWMISSY